MESLRRKSLPHEIPLWIDPRKEIYFITINCEEAVGEINSRCRMSPENYLKPSVTGRKKRLWWPHVFLLMPDHLHALISFPPSGKPLQQVVSQWKEWTAKRHGIVWQRDFFEHRLRQDESRREKADYILRIPCERNSLRVRKHGRSSILPTAGGRNSSDRDGALRRPAV